MSPKCIIDCLTIIILFDREGEREPYVLVLGNPMKELTIKVNIS